MYQALIDNWFKYHAPKGDQAERYERIRSKARELADVINASCPEGADKTASLRKLRECVMTRRSRARRRGSGR